MNVAGDSVPVFVRTLRKSSPSAPSTGRGRLFFCLYLAASRRNSCSLALLDRSPSMRRVSLLLSIGLLAACGETSAPSGSEAAARSEEHTSELQSLMRISSAVFCLKKKTQHKKN